MIILEMILIFIICFILSFITYRKSLLNLDGSITAFILGVIIGFQGGLLLIILLLIFLISAFVATRYKFEYKKELGSQEGLEGERGWTNVLANGLVPVMVLLFSESGYLSSLSFLGYETAFLLFVLSVAAAASDTLASEVGMTSSKVYLITTFERVKPGTNGGISIYGELWALIGSFYTFIVAYLLFFVANGSFLGPQTIFMGTLFGFISCQIDSILGATLERKGILTKSQVNLLAILTTVIMFRGLIYVW